MKRKSTALAVLCMLAIGLSACSAMSPGGVSATLPPPPTIAPAATMPPAATQAIPNTGGSAATMPPAATQAMPAATQAMPAATQAMPGAGASNAAQVKTSMNAKFGSILTDAQGRTLYLLTKDGPNTPTCFAACAQLWPPLLTSGAPMAGSGVDASKLGTVTRSDGGTQVTYNGHPVYLVAQDANPGDTNGQGFGGVWFVVSPSGNAIQ